MTRTPDGCLADAWWPPHPGDLDRCRAPPRRRGAVRRLVPRLRRPTLFALRTGDPWCPPDAPLEPDEIRASLRATVSGWRSWAEKLVGYEGEYRGPLRRSAVVLRALNYAPDGSDRRRAHHLPARGDRRCAQLGLPLHVGARRKLHDRRARGQRVRLRGDRASSTSSATPPPGAWPAVRDCRSCTAIRGERFIPEHELRVALRPPGQPTGADRQRRVGPDPARRLRRAARRARGRSPSSTSRSTRSSARSSRTWPTAAVLRWKDIDEGIWEVRGGADHFLYSKLMNWVALDRAVAARGRPRRGRDRVSRWTEERDQIRDAILTRGLERGHRRIHAGLRPRGARRVRVDDADRRLPPCRRSADARHDRSDRRHAHRRSRVRLPLPQRGRAAGRRRDVRHLHVLAGRVPAPGPARSTGRRAVRPDGGLRERRRACSPRRSTRRPASCSATSHRRSPTSV